MRIWFKEMHNAHLLKQTTIEDYGTDHRTKKIFRALEEACRQMDLTQPIWLETNIKEFQKSGKVRFRQDNFMESIEFDYLEMHVIEED